MPASVPTSELLVAQNVQPKGGTPGVAQESTPGGGAAPQSGGSPLTGFMPILMMLVIFVPFFLLMSRRQKKESQARASLKRGDRVMTNAGLIGELVETDDRVARVKIAPGVTVQIVANTVSPFVETQPKDLKQAPAGSEKK